MRLSHKTEQTHTQIDLEDNLDLNNNFFNSEYGGDKVRKQLYFNKNKTF